MSTFGSFGSTQPANSTAIAPQGGGGLFGATSQLQQQQPAGGLFAAQQNQSATQQTQAPSLFGNTSTNSTTTGGGLFSTQNTATNATPGNTGGLLGNQQQSQGATGGLFGSTSNQQQPATGDGLFGNLSQQQQSVVMGGGLFGNGAQQQQPTGGLFGSNAQRGQPGTAFGGSIFGNNSQQGQTTTSGGSLFGNNTTQAGTGGLFGNKPGGIFGSGLNINTNTTPATNATTTNAPNPLFGSNLNQPQQQLSGAGTLFPQAAQNQQQPAQRSTLFGSVGPSTLNHNPFSNTLTTSALSGGLVQQGGSATSTLNTNSLLSSRAPAVPTQQQADPHAHYAQLVQRIDEIYHAWNPASLQCRFQHVFYNLVDPNQVSLFRQPPNVTNETRAKAIRENPDPTCFVPTIATGFDDLRERVEAQARLAAKLQEQSKDLKARLEALRQQHSVSNSSRLLRASSQQTQLTQRLLKFIQHLHLLIPTIRSSSIRPEEEQLRGKLEEIEEEVRRGRIKSKLNELWALLGAVNAAKERGRVSGAGGDWAVVDEEGLAQLAQILSEQQAGLAHLTKILQRQMKDLEVIVGGGSGVSGEEESPMNGGDHLWSSSSTLRASSL